MIIFLHVICSLVSQHFTECQFLYAGLCPCTSNLGISCVNQMQPACSLQVTHLKGSLWLPDSQWDAAGP